MDSALSTDAAVLAVVGVVALCAALGLARASFYRRTRMRSAPAAVRLVASSEKRTHPRSLSAAERDAVVAALDSPRFCDKAPAEVYATLLDEKTYLCSVRTMYRLLASRHPVRDRRNQLRHPQYVAPELMATAPNQLWSWDITKLKTFVKSSYLHLYVIVDVFSRYVVGWMVAEREAGELAKALCDEAIAREGVAHGQLTLHADNGAAMISQPLATLLGGLGVIKSHSRPHVSNDNPFSEALFKTVKYRPAFPERFASIEHARTVLRAFFAWYNSEHHHEGLALLTPHVVHHGLADEVLKKRAGTLAIAFKAHPERFVRHPPRPHALPATVWINPPNPIAENQEAQRN